MQTMKMKMKITMMMLLLLLLMMMMRRRRKRRKLRRRRMIQMLNSLVLGAKTQKMTTMTTLMTDVKRIN
jgi:preprotein translocase subunit YajC